MHLDPGLMTLRSTIKFLSLNYKQLAQYDLQLVAIPESIWQLSLDNKCNTQRLPEEQQR